MQSLGLSPGQPDLTLVGIHAGQITAASLFVTQ
jgi:hypothetical protein